MHKDFKIGLIAGIAIAVATTVWLCTLPRLSTTARAMQTTTAKTPPADAPPQTQQPIAQSPAPAPQVISEEPQATPVPSRGEGKNNQLSIINYQSSRFHVVQKGDTLSKIAEKYYGSPRSWPKIVAANRDNLPDPNRLTPGARLIIPE